MRYRLLGPLAVTTDDGEAVPVAAPKRRALLAALLLRANRPASIDDLVADLWGEDPPAAALDSLRAHVARLRRELGDGVIVTRPPGYMVSVGAGGLDVDEFERLVERGRQAVRQGSWASAASDLRDALALWRGDALADLADEPFARSAATRLTELRLRALELRAHAELELGRAAEQVADLQRLVDEHPHREELWRLLLLALYRSGRQADALAAYHRLRRLLANELGVDPSPELQKLQVRVLQQDPTLGPAGGEQRPVVRIPAPFGRLIGRARDAETVAAMVQEGRLTSLTGPGGVGKTRLAIDVAHRLVAAYPDGVVFVDLSSVRDPTLVLSTIGQEVGGGGRPWEAIADQRVLLLVDNFEQVIEAASGMGELLQACPRLSLLVTSRAPLRIHGERVFEVPPLERDDAAQLFEARALDVLGTWRPPENLVDLVATQLDGLPLAIELAAARVRVLPPGRLGGRPVRPLDLMARGARDAPERHQTMRSTIAWSYRLLKPLAQRSLRAVSAFAGGFDLDGARAVAGADLDVLDELLDHSLVRHDAGRFFLLETIREFAAEEAERVGESAAVRDRHLDHVIDVLQKARSQYRYDTQKDVWFDTCRRERDNLRVAFDHALSTQNAAAVETLARKAGMYWLTIGAVEEGERWMTALADRTAHEDAPGRASALMLTAEYPRWTGDHTSAIAQRRQAIELARQTDDGDLLATLLDDLSYSLAALGRYDEADEALAEALQIRRQDPDDTMGMNHTCAALSELRIRQGRTDEALSIALEAQRQDRRQNLPFMWTLETDELVAHALLRAGRRSDARSAFEELLPKASAAEFKLVTLNVLMGLAEACAPEDAPRAARLLGQAERVHAESRIVYWSDAEHDSLRDRLEAELGDEAFAAHLAEGWRTPA